MADQPIEFFDGLVKGTVTGLYDLALEVISPMIIPLSKGRYAFWRTVLRAESRLSSTTCMVICICITIITFSQDIGPAASHMLGTEKGESISITYDIIVGLITAIILDILLRIYYFSVRYLDRKRNIELKLSRLCVAFIFLAYIPVGIRWLWVPFPSRFGVGHIVFFGISVFPICIILTRSFAKYGVFYRAVFASALGSITGTVVPFTPTITYQLLNMYTKEVFYRGNVIRQAETRCSLIQNKAIKVSGYLFLARPESALVNPIEVLVYYDGARSVYVGHGQPNQSSILLSAGHYVAFNISSTFYRKDLQQESLLPEFQCHIEVAASSTIADYLGDNNGAVRLSNPPDGEDIYSR